MTLMSLIAEYWSDVLVMSLAVIGGASVIVAGIAPLTKTKKDDKLAAFLKKLHVWLSKISLNTMPEDKKED